MAKKKSTSVEPRLQSLPEAPLFFHDYNGDFTPEFWEKNKDEEDPITSELICPIFAHDIVRSDILKIEFMSDLGYGDTALSKLREKAADLEYLVRTGQLPRKKKIQGTIEHVVQAQLMAASILAGIGHPAGIPAIMHAIEQGNDFYRWAMLVQLQDPAKINSAKGKDEDHSLLCPSTPAFMQTLRSAMARDAVSTWNALRAAAENNFYELLPDAQRHLQSGDKLTMVHAAGAVLHLTTDLKDLGQVAKRLTECDLSKHLLDEFVSSSRARLQNATEDLLPSLIDCVRTVCLPYLQGRKSLALFEAMYEIAYYYDELHMLFQPEDVASIESMVTKWDSTENPRRPRSGSDTILETYKKVLARFDPAQKVRMLLDKEDWLETKADKIAGPFTNDDVSIIFECAKRTRKKYGSEEHPFGPKTAHLLWKHCGEIGQAYVLKNLTLFSEEGLREIVCLSEQLDAATAARALIEAELTTLSEVELIASIPENGCCYSAIDHQLRASQRCFGDDAEAGTIPPHYASLVQRFAENSAGKLEFTNIDQIDPTDELIEEDGSQITFEFHGRKYSIQTVYSGDWFDLESVTVGLRAILEEHKIEDRFILAAEESQCFRYYFAPYKAFQPIAERFAIRYYEERGKAVDAADWRRDLIERIKIAAKGQSRRK